MGCSIYPYKFLYKCRPARKAWQYFLHDFLMFFVSGADKFIVADVEHLIVINNAA